MINLKQVIAHLPESKIKELETTTKRILETGMVTMIILFGSYARGDWKELTGKNKWFFNPKFRTGKKSDFDLLLLTKDERDCKDLKNRISKMFENAPTAVQATVETLGFVNMHLREGQYFFTEIKEQGIVLYKDDHVELVDAEDLTPKKLREIAEQDFKHWFEQAKDFYETHKFDKGRNRYNKASFELQQCVENCYTCIEMIFSRNNPYEHRLTILRMNAKRYTPEIDSCFPQQTKKEIDLFLYLDAAYIGGRYIDEKHYKVTKAQLDYWQKETKKLLKVTEKECQKRIETLRAKELKS